MEEAPRHRHNVARGAFVDVGGVVQPAPAPRFSRTPAASPTPPPPQDSGAEGSAVLRAWGIAEQKIRTLSEAGVLAG
jgi:alpha-methylacyl-CoA racemase